MCQCSMIIYIYIYIYLIVRYSTGVGEVDGPAPSHPPHPAQVKRVQVNPGLTPDERVGRNAHEREAEERGRNPLQLGCVNKMRLGCVT